MTGLIFAVVLSYLFPAKYKSNDPDAVARLEKINGITLNRRADTSGEAAGSDNESKSPDRKSIPEKGEPGTPDVMAGKNNNGLVEFLEGNYTEPMDEEAVRKATRLVVWFDGTYTLIAVLLVPFALYGSSWIFTRAGFKAWCVVSFIWIWVGMFICVVWPLVESRETMSRICKGIIRDVTGGKSRPGQPSSA
jgi:hypothetical protein